MNLNYEYASGIAFDFNGKSREYKYMILTHNSIKVKKSKADYPEKIDLKLFKKFIIGGDTLITVADTVINQKRKFKKYIILGKTDETENYLLFQRKLKNKTKYYLKNKQTDEWLEVNYRFDLDFQTEVVSLFEHVPYIKLKRASFGYNDIKNLIKSVRYYERYKANKSLYFSSLMNDVTDTEKMTYYCQVENLVGSIWTISFYNKQGQKLLKGEYSNVAPLTKHGNHKWFYPDGKIRKEAQFIEGDLDGSYLVYNHDGTKHCTFKYTKNGDMKVLSIFDNKGVEQTKDIKKHTYYDYINDRTLNIQYKYNKLNKISYVDNASGVKYYLLTDIPASSKIKVDLDYPQKELKEGKEGMVRIRIMLDEKGGILDYKVLSTVDGQFIKPSVDLLLNKESIKFKPAANFEGKVKSEFIYTVMYKIHRTIIHSNYDFMFHHNMMMQQQMMTPQISPPTGY
ncbi:energy transducer TonB [Fulvivirga sediminis]|uniref:Energy transducer TonB n=1 Tax=Fulvivirga sediminis TaxID=2803949 RepID=A0A937K368_9BACT|nr:energy transducer TonB [Fulvivirga sediminis]MBL3659095.1 energy transducer TonB [Fulvivirga sediminis]